MPRITERIDRRLFSLANKRWTTGRVVFWALSIYASGALSMWLTMVLWDV